MRTMCTVPTTITKSLTSRSFCLVRITRLSAHLVINTPTTPPHCCSISSVDSSFFPTSNIHLRAWLSRTLGTLSIYTTATTHKIFPTGLGIWEDQASRDKRLNLLGHALNSKLRTSLSKTDFLYYPSIPLYLT